MNRHVNPEDSDLYALGALDGAEMQELEAHLRSCAECASEVDAARQRVALLALAAPAATPPARVKDALLWKVRAERAPEGHRGQREAERSSGWGWLTPVFGLATVLFAALAAGIWMKDVRDSRRVYDLEGQLALAQSRSVEIAKAAAETDQLLGMPGTMQVNLAEQPGGSSGRAGVLYNSRTGMAMFAGQMAPAPVGKSYQLWMVPTSGAPMSLGVFSAKNPTVEMSAHVPPGTMPKAFAVTIEPQGGMQQPTGAKVLVGAVG